MPHYPEEGAIRFNPLRAWRPAPGFAAKVAAPPYDVVNRAEAAALAHGNPLSFLHVGRAEIDLPADVDPYDSRVYLKARENLHGFMAQGVLEQDRTPSLYVYEQTMNGRVQAGVVGCVHIDDYERDVIKKHEKTRPDKEDDRTRHTLTLNANAEPVFLTYRAQPFINQAVAAVRNTPPRDDFTTNDGVRHRTWRVEDPRPLLDAFRRVPAAFVADGHHRCASAWRAGKQLREQSVRSSGNEEYNWFLAVMFPSDVLQILPYNRVVKDLGSHSPAEFLKALEGTGSLTQTDTPEPEAPGSFGIYLDGQWYRLTLDPATIRVDDPIASLDAMLLQERILAPLLGVGDPRTDQRLDFVGGIRGTDALKERVDRGDAAVAFALYPTSLEQLLTVSAAGLIMPPKTTWFEPKLRSGLFVHTLD
ncbi:MAG TPA: DUF1015 domain-containing protein [Gemmatimonadales bacterium]|nr:DUF1015 domain-containing protein [Gemmatimonadales bacterium]